MGFLQPTKNKTYSTGPYGESSDPAAQGLQQQAIKNAAGVQPQAQNLAAGAAANPVWGSVSKMLNDQAQGKYLSGSPELRGQINAVQTLADRQAADQNANMRSQYNRGGLNWSTANQQAQQAQSAASRLGGMEQANRLIGQNYTNERGYQQNTGALAQQALQAPIDLLYRPATDAGHVLSGVPSQMNSAMVQEQTPWGQAMNLISSLGGMARMAA